MNRGELGTLGGGLSGSLRVASGKLASCIPSFSTRVGLARLQVRYRLPCLIASMTMVTVTVDSRNFQASELIETSVETAILGDIEST